MLTEDKFYERNDQYILNTGINVPDKILIFDLGQHYEAFDLGRDKVGTCPIDKDYVVTAYDSTYKITRTYRVDRIHCKKHKKTLAENGYDFNGHCYIFVDITLNAPEMKRPFAKKPSAVQELIKNKKLTIISTPQWK